jgi:hypothetical protein
MKRTAVPGKKSIQRGRRHGSKGQTNTGSIAANIKISNNRIIYPHNALSSHFHNPPNYATTGKIR